MKIFLTPEDIERGIKNLIPLERYQSSLIKTLQTNKLADMVEKLGGKYAMMPRGATTYELSQSAFNELRKISGLGDGNVEKEKGK